MPDWPPRRRRPSPQRKQASQLLTYPSVPPSECERKFRPRAQQAGTRLCRMIAKQIPAPGVCQYINQNELLLTEECGKAMLAARGQEGQPPRKPLGDRVGSET